MPRERLQKVLASRGVASRRKAEEMIKAGRISVNDQVVREMGVRVDANNDTVCVDGKQVVPAKKKSKLYLLLHKPTGVVSTTKDDRGRRTVLDLVPEYKDRRLVLAGRLDYHSEGLILLTNDGDLVYQMTHPKNVVAKTYHAKVKGKPKESKLEFLRNGIQLEDGPTRPAHVEVIGPAQVNTWVEITITEGRNRQVRRMFDKIYHPVQRLIRVSMASLTLEGLPYGTARPLNKAEVLALKHSIES